MRRAAVLLAILLLGTRPAGACVGDCDDDGSVTIGELITSVAIVLGDEPLGRCTAIDSDGDGTATVQELVAAVGAALDGCNQPTPTPVPAGCGNGTLDVGEECDDGNRIGGDGCSASCTLELGSDPCAGVRAFPGAGLATALVTDAVEHPVHISAPRLDPHRVFIVEQPGRIRIVRDGVLLAQPFLAIEDLVSCCEERGLLSVAFHPAFASNGRFFVDYTDRRGNTVIARYQVGADPDRADPDSARILLTVEQPFANHNGGQLAFGPDGYLYLGMGDGGSAGDPFAHGQDDATLLGKLLRLDVDVDTPPYYAVPATNPFPALADPFGLIWAKGLRNPWRFSFDRGSGDLYIADVGQDRFEEIDVQPAASAGGENYGWRIFEGDTCFNPSPAPRCPARDGFVFPVLVYTHDEGCSITGGFVYRGCALPDLRGEYFYGDYCAAFLRTFRLDGGAVTAARDRTAELAPGGGRSIGAVVSFGEDARGELYIADYDGEVYKIIPAPSE